MITEKDLQEQIEKYQGQINITPDECVKLSAMYLLKHFIYGDEQLFGFSEQLDNPKQYSFAAAPEQSLNYDSGTEFSELIQSLDITRVLSVIDELLTYEYVYNKPLYNATIQKLREQG